MTRDAIGKVKGQPLRLPGVWTFHSVETARRHIRDIAPGAVCFARSPEDVLSIVESWHDVS